MRIRPRRLRLTVEQISFPLGVHMRQISFAQAKKVSEIKHVYEARPRKDKRGVNLISDALPFGRLWYGEPNASDFVIKNYRPPHPIGVKGGCSPQNNCGNFRRY